MPNNWKSLPIGHNWKSLTVDGMELRKVYIDTGNGTCIEDRGVEFIRFVCECGEVCFQEAADPINKKDFVDCGCGKGMRVHGRPVNFSIPGSVSLRFDLACKKRDIWNKSGLIRVLIESWMNHGSPVTAEEMKIEILDAKQVPVCRGVWINKKTLETDKTRQRIFTIPASLDGTFSTCCSTDRKSAIMHLIMRRWIADPNCEKVEPWPNEWTDKQTG